MNSADYRAMYNELNAKNEDFENILLKMKDNQQLSTRNLISIEDLTPKDIELIFRIAYAFKDQFIKRPNKKIPLLKGKFQLNAFFETSTRTRLSFELAGKHLSADTINISGDASSMAKKGETLNDTVRTIDSMNPDVLIVRHNAAGTPEMIAKEVRCPVLNAGDGWHEHPTQCLLDLYTMQEAKGKIKGINVVVVGDILHSRVAGSLLRGLKMMGANTTVCGPPTLLPAGLEEEFGCKVTYNIEEGVKDKDVIYALRIQRERAAGAFVPSIREYSKQYCINPGRLKRAKKDAIVMHPGPINREVDLRTEVMDGPQSKVEEQVTNGFCVRLALLYLIVKGEEMRKNRGEELAK